MVRKYHTLEDWLIFKTNCVSVYVSHSVVSNSMTPWSSPPGSFVQGILQARILDNVAISFFKTILKVTFICVLMPFKLIDY